VDWLYDAELQIVIYRLTKPLRKNEEAFINYGDRYWKGRDLANPKLRRTSFA